MDKKEYAWPLYESEVTNVPYRPFVVIQPFTSSPLTPSAEQTDFTICVKLLLPKFCALKEFSNELICNEWQEKSSGPIVNLRP